MDPHFPYWLNVLNALSPLFTFLGTVVIGGFAAYFARGQWRTNEDKLRLDLYDRRLAVYEAAMKFLVDLTATGKVEPSSMHQYLVATRQATFLFEDDAIPAYLRTLASEAQKLNEVAGPMRSTAADVQAGTAHGNAPEAVWELLDWFLQQENVVGEKFAPYLRLRA
jgi:hypothetical protein